MFRYTLAGDAARAAGWVPFARSKAREFDPYLSAGGVKTFNLDSTGFIRLSKKGGVTHAHISVRPGVEGYEFFFMRDLSNDLGHYARTDFIGLDGDGNPQFEVSSVGADETGAFLPVAAQSEFTGITHPLSPMLAFGLGRRQGDARVIANRPRIPDLMDAGVSFDYNTHDRTFPPGTGFNYLESVDYGGVFYGQPWRGRFKSQGATVGPGFLPLVVPFSGGTGGAFTVMVQYVLNGAATVDFYLPDTGDTVTAVLPSWMGSVLRGNHYINWKMNDAGDRIVGVMGPREFFWNLSTGATGPQNNSFDRFHTHNYGYVEFVLTGTLDGAGNPQLSVQLGRNEQNHGCVFDAAYPWGSDTLRIVRSAYQVGGWLQATDDEEGTIDALLKIAIRAEWIDVDINGTEGPPFRAETIYHGPFARTFKTLADDLLDWGGGDGEDAPIWPLHGSYYVRPTQRSFETGNDLHDLVKDNSPYHYIHRRIVALDLRSDSYCIRREELHPVAFAEALGPTAAYWAAFHFSREHRLWGGDPEVALAGVFTPKAFESFAGYEEYAPGHPLWSDALRFATYHRTGLSDLLRLCFPEPFYNYQTGAAAKLNMFYRDWGFIVSQPNGNIAVYVPSLPYYYGTDAGIEGYPDLDLINFAYLDEEGTMQFRSTSHAQVIQQLWPTLGTITADDVDLIASSGAWGRKP